MNRQLVEQVLIQHPTFGKGLKRLEQNFASAQGAAEPICTAVIGESRTGKSRLLEEFMHRHPTNRTRDGLLVPVLKAVTPARPTVKGLVEALLQNIGDPKWYEATETRKTARLRALLKEAGTTMLILDEFQHFRESNSERVMNDVANWLKNLVNQTNVALTVAGLPTCSLVISQDPQLTGRFSRPIRMTRFDWVDEGQREQFRQILKAYRLAMGDTYKMLALESDPLAFRCYCATGGLIGYLAKFLRQAVWDAVDAKRTSISLTDLRAAHENSVWDEIRLDGCPNPFDKRFDPVQTTEVLEKVAQLGVAKEPSPPKPRASRRRRL